MSGVRFLAFAFLCLLVSPVLILGITLYSLRIFFVGRPLGISGTAYEPLWCRLFLDELGLREDRAAAKLAPHLPALSPFVVKCVSGLMCWAARVSGYRGAFFTYPPEHPTSLMTMVNHRCEFFDRTLCEAVEPPSGPGVQQVVILGAGWDSRAYGVLKDKDVRFFEVDMPPTQGAKKAALKKGGVDADHVTFVETDFNQRSWFDALKAHGFDPAIPTFILWEGVTMYLDEDAVRSTLGHVAQLAPGSRSVRLPQPRAGVRGAAVLRDRKALDRVPQALLRRVLTLRDLDAAPRTRPYLRVLRGDGTSARGARALWQEGALWRARLGRQRELSEQPASAATQPSI